MYVPGLLYAGALGMHLLPHLAPARLATRRAGHLPGSRDALPLLPYFTRSRRWALVAALAYTFLALLRTLSRRRKRPRHRPASVAHAGAGQVRRRPAQYRARLLPWRCLPSGLPAAAHLRRLLSGGDSASGHSRIGWGPSPLPSPVSFSYSRPGASRNSAWRALAAAALPTCWPASGLRRASFKSSLSTGPPIPLATTRPQAGMGAGRHGAGRDRHSPAVPPAARVLLLLPRHYAPSSSAGSLRHIISSAWIIPESRRYAIEFELFFALALVEWPARRLPSPQKSDLATLRRIVAPESVPRPASPQLEST